MVDLKAFRRANKLTQADVAKFLSVSAPFITRVERGLNKLPEDKLLKLMNNDEGWNVSVLIKDDMAPRGDSIQQVGGNNIGKVVGGKVSMPANKEIDEKVDQLLLAIERRDLQVNELIQQNKTLVEVIKNLTSK